MSIEGINELLSDHYYIWQGDDDSIPELTNDPAVQWSTDALKRSHLGDFFINTLGYCYKFIQQGNTYKWVEVNDRYIVPYAKRIAGKSTIFISQPEAEDIYSPGDIWLNVTYKDNGETYIEEYEGEKYSDSDTEQFTYEFNEDGTLHRAGETFFKYGTIAEQGDVDKYKAKVTRAEKSRKRGYMFGLRHKNRRK